MKSLLVFALAVISLAVAGCLPFGAGAALDSLTGPQPTPEPPAPIIVSPPNVHITVPVINAAGGDMPSVKANRHEVDVTPPAPAAPAAVTHSGNIQLEGTVQHEGAQCTYTLPDGRTIDCQDLGDHVEWVEDNK